MKKKKQLPRIPRSNVRGYATTQTVCIRLFMECREYTQGDRKKYIDISKHLHVSVGPEVNTIKK